MNWFETTGKAHMKEFFSMLINTLKEGQARGLKVKRIDLNDALRIYRGESVCKPKNERNYNPNRKLTNDDVVEIRRLRSTGWRHKEIAEKYDISAAYVNDLLNNNRRICNLEDTVGG